MNHLRILIMTIVVVITALYIPASSSIASDDLQVQTRYLYAPSQGDSTERPVVLEHLPPSAFEVYVNGLLDAGAPMRQFGYDLFLVQDASASFSRSQSLPVGPDYLIGPGDRLNVTLWGKVNWTNPAVVDRDGSITLPQLGVVHIAGLTFAEAREFLATELARYYKAGEVKMNMSMGELRSMRVFVVGNVRSPGSYLVSSMSTLLNALIVAGGPSKAGTMRNIEVKRGGQTVATFDLYDFILGGDKGDDIRLAPEDVIFVPSVGPLAAISGNVNTPAIYEIKDERTVSELIALSGGLNDIAFMDRLQVSRVKDGRAEVVFESSLDDERTREAKVMPGDILRVFSVVSDRSVVRVSGAVQREGGYGVDTEMTVSSLIKLAGGLRDFAFRKDAELTRVTPTETGPETVKLHINLDSALSGDPVHDIPLKKDDYLFVRAVPEWVLYETVTVHGEVRFPGAYTIKKGELFSELIERAGGYTSKAYLKGAVFTRDSVRAIQQRQLDESIARFEQEMLSSSITDLEGALSPEEARQQQAAMGQRRALIAKLRAVKAQGRVAITLRPMDEFSGSTSDLRLEEGDNLFIPSTPSQVQVIGSVYNQTSFVYEPDATLGGYINRAGGLTRNADDDEIYVLKVDGTAISRRMGSGWGIRWDRENSRWVGGGFMSTYLDPGDTIVVPAEIEKIQWLKEFRDITQILYQVAVTAGVLIVAF